MDNKETAGLSDECVREIRVKDPCKKQTTLAITTAEKSQDNQTYKVRNLSKVINSEHFRDITKLFRITAIVFKFVALLKNRDKLEALEGREHILSTENVREGRNAWILTF